MSDLAGIVLMGGKSSRMGRDKSQLQVTPALRARQAALEQLDYQNYLSKTELNFAELAASKLQPFVNDVYFSINENQQILGLGNNILDEYAEEGPLSGIISALRATQSSILLLAVDMPLITLESIKHLINNRNWDLLSTSYYDEHSHIWEPMLSIWELETLPCLEEYFENGGRSIQKFLNKFGNQRVPISNPLEFTNVNEMQEYLQLSSK